MLYEVNPPARRANHHAPSTSPLFSAARRMTLAGVGGLLVLGASAAMARAQTNAPAAPVDGPSFVPMVLALVLVLGLLGVALWVLRRAGFAPRGGSSQLRLVTQLALGPRERVVIVEAGERWWLLGVGASGVTRLGSLPKGDAAASEMPAASFGALLEKLRVGQR
jgi:flagellar protein FliO/FliZ